MSLLRVALTGGIATGKSYVLGRLGALGLPIIDADRIARQVVAPETHGWARVRDRFGEAILRPDGEIDRAKLAALIFADPTARSDLEAIVHPEVYDAIDRWFRDLAAANVPMAIADVPLLYETGHENSFDAVIVAACAPATQLHRLIARDGISESQARERLAAQLPIDQKAARADYVIDTEGSKSDTDRQVVEVFERLRNRLWALGSGPS